MSNKTDKLRNINEQIRITERLIELNEQQQELMQRRIDALENYGKQLDEAIASASALLASIK
jgi:hypothetical protein